jgi:hypothetical protein
MFWRKAREISKHRDESAWLWLDPPLRPPLRDGE